MQTKKLQAKGFFVYQDEQGRDIYYDWFRKRGYYLRAEHLKSFTFYKNRILLLLAGCFLAYNFLTSSLLTLSIFFCGFLLLWEFVFRNRFLSKLQVVPDFVPNKKQSVVDRVVREDDLVMIGVRILLYSVLAILLPWNAHESLSAQPLLIYGSYILAFGALANAAFYGYAFWKKRKNPVLVEKKTKKRKKK